MWLVACGMWLVAEALISRADDRTELVLLARGIVSILFYYVELEYMNTLVYIRLEYIACRRPWQSGDVDQSLESVRPSPE